MTDINQIAICSPDIRQERLEQLKEIFPDLFDGEGKLDDNALKALILDDAGVVTERFTFEWAGKQKSKRFAFTPSKATLQFDAERSLNRDGSQNKLKETLLDNTSENLIIEGDNLEVLKLLQVSYFEKVKCIYIDPPYNKNADVIYPDDYTDTQRSYWEKNGTVKDGVRLSAVSESSGRRHSNWLNMMQSRLLQARNLLRPDGVILMSIGSDEEHNLRNLGDQIFGESNFIIKMVWAAGRKNDSKFVSDSHEYILIYARNKVFLNENKIIWRKQKKGLESIYAAYNRLRIKHKTDNNSINSELKNWYSNLPNSNPAKRHKDYCKVDNRGVYFADNISWPGGGGPKYEVKHPITDKPCKVPSRGWMFGELKKMQEMIDDDRVHFGETEESVPCIKSYLVDREYEVPNSVFYQDGRASTKRLRALMGGDYFEHPKDELVLQELIEAISYYDKDGIFMDFFAGSGTFGHSILLQNDVDSGKRKFVLVQIPEFISEKTGSKRNLAFEAGFRKISDITISRVALAGNKIIHENPQSSIDSGFRVFKLSDSNFPQNLFSPDTAKSEEENLKALDKHLLKAAQMRLFSNNEFCNLVTEISIKNGFGLFYKLTPVDGIPKNKVYRLTGNDKSSLLCFDDDLHDETIEDLKPLKDELLIVSKSALDTSKKFNLQSVFKDNLWVI